MLRGRQFVIAAGLVAVVLGCASCSSTGGSSPALAEEPDDNTIVWRVNSITLSDNDPRKILVDYFQKAHPKIKVRIASAVRTDTDSQRDDLKKVLKSAPSRAGAKSDELDEDTVPDVYLGDVIWPAEFGEERLALPLNDIFPARFWRRFEPGDVGDSSYKGKIYAVPFYTEQGLLYYRADLLEQEGLQAPSTWEELADQSKLLVSKKRVVNGFVWQGAKYEGLMCNWMEFLADAGGRPLDDAGTRSLVNSPQSLKALRFMRSLITSGASPEAVTTFEEPHTEQLFKSGRAAFLRAWHAAYASMPPPGTTTAGGGPVRMEVTALPTFAGEPAPGHATVGGWSLYINPKIKSNKKKLTMVQTFVDWMTDVQAQRIIARYHEVPANVVVRQDRAMGDDPVLAAAGRATKVHRPSKILAYSRVSGAISGQVNAALKGDVSPEAALRNADDEVNRIVVRRRTH